MGLAFIQASAELHVASGTSGTINLSGVGAGNTLVVLAENETNNTDTFTVSDNNGGVWNLAISKGLGATASLVDIHFAANVAAGNVTITITATHAINIYARAIELSGDATVAPLECRESKFENAATTSHVCGENGVLSQSDCFIACISGLGNAAGTRTPGTGYTALSSASNFLFYQYGIFTGAQSGNQGAYTSGNAQTTVGVMAAFRVAPVSLPVVLRSPVRQIVRTNPTRRNIVCPALFAGPVVIRSPVRQVARLNTIRRSAGRALFPSTVTNIQQVVLVTSPRKVR